MQDSTLLPSLRFVPTPAGQGPVRFAPPVARALADRGFQFRVPGEDGDARERRVETELMTLFRDTRLNAAFEALYERSSGSLFTWILHMLSGRGQSADPHELLQDTFINIYRYARSFRPEGGNTFRGWARTIAANVVRRARMRTMARPTIALPQGAQEPEDVRRGPERSASDQEQTKQLRKAWTLLLLHYATAFQKLSERDREALHLVEVEGLSYDEAGAVLKVGRSNMKMIMFRSRKRIRAHIARAMVGAMESAEEPAREPLPLTAAG